MEVKPFKYSHFPLPWLLEKEYTSHFVWWTIFHQLVVLVISVMNSWYSITWLECVSGYRFLERFWSRFLPSPPALVCWGSCLCCHRRDTWRCLWAMFGMSYFLLTVIIESYRGMMPMLLGEVRKLFERSQKMCMIRDLFFSSARCGQCT